MQLLLEHLARTACEQNDTTLLDRAISATSPQDDLEQLYQYSCGHAIQNNSKSVLEYLIEHGISVRSLWPTAVANKGHTSTAILEILLAHGWDINFRDASRSGPEAWPFMWHIVSNSELVAWCLEHGASVNEPLDEYNVARYQPSCPPILERVAYSGSIASFDLLRSKGAPFGWRPLHLAVEAATCCCLLRQVENEKENEKRSRSDERKYRERMDMVRHLVDVVGLDVNAPDQPEGGKLPMRHGTPLCYPPALYLQDADTRELTWFLLDRGADPIPALAEAKASDDPRFIDEVEQWMSQQASSRKCCIQ